jgi:hypothetical protein
VRLSLFFISAKTEKLFKSVSQKQIMQIQKISGGSCKTRNVAALSESQIPSSAWIKLYVTQNKEIVIVSSNVAINILDNQ